MDMKINLDVHSGLPSTLRLLHVEDNKVDVLLISAMLKNIERLRFESDHAATLNSALEKLKQTKYNLVLLDLFLPDSEGIETLNRIQQLAPKLPVIIITGNDREDSIRLAICSGAQDYLVKEELNKELLKKTLLSAIDRKRIQEALKESEERLKFALEASNDGFWDWNIKSETFYLSNRSENILGYNAGELEQQLEAWQGKIHPDDIQNVTQNLNAHLEGLASTYISEYRIKSKSGEWLWILTRGRIVSHDKDGKPARMAGTHLDITPRKLSEQALKQSEERFQLAVEGSNDGIWDWQDISKDEEYWSPRFKELLGYAEDEITASYTQFQKLLHPEDTQRVMLAVDEHFKQDKPFNIEYRLLTKNDGYHWFRARGHATRDKQGNPVRLTGSISDVTFFKKAQEEKNVIELQLRQSQKLEAIGQLAAGVAHEINTPVQFVSDNIRFLQESFNDLQQIIQAYQALATEVEKENDQYESVQKIQDLNDAMDLSYLLEEIPTAVSQSLEGINRISSIVKAMKEFSHPGSSDKKPNDINKSINNTIIVSRNEWKYIAEMETHLDPDLPMVECMPGELNQVILNMIVNAAHAIEEAKNIDKIRQGKITIRTEHVGDHVLISISDTGSGISKEIQNKIFDPFFTTKDVGKGTGQGLAIAYSVVVDKHQGEIHLESEPGKGSTFTIKLPILSQSSEGEENHEKTRAIC